MAGTDPALEEESTMRPKFHFARLWTTSCCGVACAPPRGTHVLKTEIHSIALTLLVVLSSGSIAVAQGAFTIDVPGATFTRIFGLNAQGNVCGGALLNGIWHGFVAS